MCLEGRLTLRGQGVPLLLLQGLGIFRKGSCDSHKHLLAHNWLERHDARLWKVKLHPSAPCFRLGRNCFTCSDGLSVSWQVSEVLGTEV